MSISIETWRWLATPEGQEAILCAPADRSPTAIARLRKTYDAEQVRGLLEVSEARAKGAAKLDRSWAASMLADKAGVEMASSARSSVYKAQRFAEVLGHGAFVADLCCGIGADSWGLGGAGLRVSGVDRDASRVEMYSHNLPWCEGVCGDAFADCPSDVEAFHLDPARRAGSRRSRSIEDFQPGPEVWSRIIDRVGSGAIKLNPGVDGEELAAGELEIIGEAGGLTQAVLWLGRLSGEAARRATVLGASGVCSIAGEAYRPDEASAIGGYLGTIDPAPERADLVGVLLDELGVSLVHPGTGLVTAESPVAHPMVRWYRTLEVLPWNVKRVKSVLRGLGCGVVEVRTRGGVVNPDQLQRKLRGDGERADLAVLVYRLGDRIVAIIAEQVRSKEPAGEVVPTGLDGGRGDA
ncbi:MAG: hypothetical protein JJ916_02335 [Phycisphaerales bacterium]|nr:hypothetical protein [Phycisphaerales bacterium]